MSIPTNEDGGALEGAALPGDPAGSVGEVQPTLGEGNSPLVRTFLRASPAQLALLDTALVGLNRATRALIVHLLASTLALVSKGEPPQVPLSFMFLRRHFKGAQIDRLVDAGVVVVHPHDYSRGLSREYEIGEAFLAKWFGAVGTAEGSSRDGLLDAATSAPANRPRRHRLTRVPDLARQAALSVRESVFNATAAEHALADRETLALALPPGPERDRATKQFRAAASRYAAVLAQRPTPTGTVTPSGDELFRYSPAYEVQSFGRLGERAGGFQSAPRWLKAAGRLDVPDCRNLDLDNAQLRLAVVALDRAGVDPYPILDYLSRPGSRAMKAAYVGVPEPVFKRALIGLVMGGHAPRPSQLRWSDGKVVRVLRKAVDPADFLDCWTRFYDVTSDIRPVLRQWHEGLPGWAEQTGRVYNRDGGLRITNAAGAVVSLFSLSPSGDIHEVRAKIAAFTLQGLEAAVVQRICVSSAEEDSGFEVYSVEHDGIIVRGVVGANVVERAAREAGVPPEMVVLVEKPFE